MRGLVKKLVVAALAVVTGGVLVLSPAGDAYAQQLLELDELILETEVERPEAFFFRQPLPLEYESRPMRESFLQELYDTVEDDPAI